MVAVARDAGGATGLVSAGLVLAAVGRQDIGAEAWVNVPLAVGFSTVAAGIWSTRPHTAGLRRLAVLYTVVGVASAFVLPAHGWAGADVPGADASAWLSNWVWAFGAAPLLGLGLVLYPEGTLPSRRWWPVLVLGIAATFTLALSGALMPGSLDARPKSAEPSWVGRQDLLGGRLRRGVRNASGCGHTGIGCARPQVPPRRPWERCSRPDQRILPGRGTGRRRGLPPRE